MQNRTLYALLSAALLAVTGTVFAQTEPDATTDAANASFELKISPAEARVKPGDTVTFSVIAGSRIDQSLQLSLRVQDGIRATLSSETLDVVGGSPSRVVLTAGAPDNATRSPYSVVVIATSEDGTIRDAKATVHIAPPQPERPAEKPQAKPEPRPAERPQDRPTEPRPATTARPEPAGTSPNDKRYDVLEHRFRVILERLDRIEKRLDHLEQRMAPPTKPAEPDRQVVRMTLSQEHAAIGPDGGTVALLFTGGEKDVRVPLGLRYNESSGWRVGLEQDVVFVPAHQRAWIWVKLSPPASCANTTAAAESACDGAAAASRLEYAIAQIGTPGPYLAKGTASARMP